MGICPHQPPIPTSQISQDVPDQTEMIYGDVRKNAMRAYIKHKAYYDKKANASKPKESDYGYVLQPKAHYQGSKILLTEFWWIGPEIIEKVLPNNDDLVRKIGTNKTQVLHRMRMGRFTPHQPPADVRITPNEWKPDPQVSLKHDDFYARAWGSVNKNSQFLTPRIITQRRPIHPKRQYSLMYQLMKCGTHQEPHKIVT